MRLAISALGAATLIALTSAFPARAADLTLAVSTTGTGGSVAVAVYRDASSFRLGQGPIASRIVPRTGAVTTVTFPGLAAGRYAVAAYHDTDGNGTLTLWPFGLPKEAYGFSRNARGRFGPPSFDSAAFDLLATGTQQAFALR